jgi:GH25 family lysozyme M1 (1,4-beta-N-acetylmuramidase)
MTDLIIDLSEFQDCVDVERLKNTSDSHVTIRIGYGREYYQFDKNFSDIYNRAREAGLLIEGYLCSY